MADIVRCAGQSFLEHSRKWMNWQHQKVLLAIARCRTAALGGHRDRCTGCGHTTRISYNSCRNRHCTRCQGNARQRWLQARERELLPTRYVHAVFTLPRNSCFARHLNQTGTQHEALSTSSAFERASAPTRILLFIRPKPRGRQSLQPPHQTSASHAAVPSGLQAIGSYPTQSVPDPSAPAQTDSKCIAFHEGGFLQVAVSEAPHPGACNCAMSCAGALQIQH